MLNDRTYKKKGSITGNLLSMFFGLSILLFTVGFVFMATWDMPQPKEKVTKEISTNKIF